MDFITEEIVKELNLTPEQVAGIKPHYDGHIATEKQAWDNKANTDAEGILSGAASKLAESTGVQRNQGEKLADYYVRAGKEFLSNKESELSTAKADYEKKLKDFKGDEATKQELADTKQKYDDVLQKYADYDDLKVKADKYDPLNQELSGLKLNVAFHGVKPSMPDTVNKYEFDAKWGAFQKTVLEKNTIELVDNVPFAIDNENPHKKTKLSDLVSADKELTDLLKGREQRGLNSKQEDFRKIDGVPFEVPDKATKEELSKIINEHLDKEGIGKMDKGRSAKFTELWAKVSK